MQLPRFYRPREPELDDIDPWKDDPLARKSDGENLARLIRSTSGPYVISLRAPWGSGKSVFLRRLQRTLTVGERPVKTILVDAWRSDHLEDPLVAFVLALKEEFPPGKTRKLAKALAAVLEVGGSAAAVAVSTVAGPPVGAAVKAGARAAAGAIDRAAKFASAREEFKAALQSATESNRADRFQPVAILVDELDRCRPDFAILLLERIKHFFDVPGVVFVMATDGDNLPAAVGSVYGDKIDGERYLRKFVDFEYRLADPRAEDMLSLLWETYRVVELCPVPIEALVKEFHTNSWQFRGARGREAMALAVMFPEAARALALSLRDQIQAFPILIGVLRAAPATLPLMFPAILFAVALRFAIPSLYEKLLRGEVTFPMLFAHTHELSREFRSSRAYRTLQNTELMGWLEIFSSLTANHANRSTQINQRMNQRPVADEARRSINWVFDDTNNVTDVDFEEAVRSRLLLTTAFG